jgi:hypothetical protein
MSAEANAQSMTAPRVPMRTAVTDTPLQVFPQDVRFYR